MIRPHARDITVVRDDQIGRPITVHILDLKAELAFQTETAAVFGQRVELIRREALGQHEGGFSVKSTGLGGHSEPPIREVRPMSPDVPKVISPRDRARAGIFKTDDREILAVRPLPRISLRPARDKKYRQNKSSDSMTHGPTLRLGPGRQPRKTLDRPRKFKRTGRKTKGLASVSPNIL